MCDFKDNNDTVRIPEGTLAFPIKKLNDFFYSRALINAPHNLVGGDVTIPEVEFFKTKVSLCHKFPEGCTYKLGHCKIYKKTALTEEIRKALGI